MSKNNEIPSEGGHVNWDKLGRTPRKGGSNGRVQKAKTKVQHENEEEVAAELNLLTEEEKASPYPDEFLAEVNLMRKKITGSKADISNMADDDDAFDDDEVDDEIFDDDDDDDDEDGFDDDDDFNDDSDDDDDDDLDGQGD